MSAPAALGFAPHSGWSVLVALGLEGAEARPRVLARERVELSGPEDPGSKQPYHTLKGLPLEDAARRLELFRADAGRRANAALVPALASLAAAGRRVVGVGILDSAGRRGASLEATLGSHALIHTADGDHFRGAIAAAAERNRLRVTRIRTKELEARAAEVLGRTPEILRETLENWRREAGPPWGADQKAAALLAWLVLSAAS
jgi:hypothetical protein